jgi:outer membrane protein OmpA-like peptidoglycan-associated protein
MFQKKTDESNWVSIADMMTALMIIFMFIAINYILQIIEHTFIEEDIYNKIETEFKEEIANNDIELGPDGAIRFRMEDGNKLFEVGDARPTENFKEKLRNFIPKYWEIINSDSTYLNFIKEIRIEGHADDEPYFKDSDVIFSDEVSYLNNLELSQARAASVLKFLREQDVYLKAPQHEKERIDFLFTSIGFSYSRAINESGKYVYLDSNKSISRLNSRRVEFRIVTSNKDLAKSIIKANEQ